MTERHSDPLDQANDVAQDFVDGRVEEYRRLAAPEQNPDNIDPDCSSCGEPIEEGRLALLKCRCLSCQVIWENKRRMYA